MFVIKRDGTKEKFDKVKIVKAIEGAIIEVDGDLENNSIAQEIADAIDIPVDELLEEVAVSCDYEDVDDVDYYDVAKYAEDVYEDEIYQAYLDIVESLDTDYHWDACHIWDEFINDSNIEVI